MEGASVMMSTLYEAKTAKKVYLYRNGAPNSQAKCLVVNDRQVRDFSTFLNRVTSGLKAPVAIRNIYTPSGGHKVKNLKELRSGHYYVAGGAEHFKKVKYGDSPQKLLTRRPPRTELIVPPRTHQAVVASARYKKPVDKPFIIHVFRNGDERYRGARVLLTRRVMGSWEHVLEIVADKVNLFTPVKRLCTLDGRTLHAVSELQDGGKYVAIEGTKPFQRISYCATEEKKFLRHTTLPRIAVRLRRRSERLTDTEEQDGGLGDSGKPPFLTQSLQRRVLKRRQSRPMAGRKNKEAREKAIEDHRADSIFGGSPTHKLSSPSPPPQHQAKQEQKPHPLKQKPHPLLQNQTLKAAEPTTHTEPVETSHASRNRVSPEVEKREVEEKEEVTLPIDSKATGLFHAPANNQTQEQHSQEYSEETQGDSVFKAKTESTEVEDAEVVVESGETEVEKPVDLEEAEEVEEEREDKEQTTTQQQAMEDVELKTQPLETSIDLSLNRNTLVEETSLPPPEPSQTTPPSDGAPQSDEKTDSEPPPAPAAEVVVEEAADVVESRTHSVLSKKESKDEDAPEERTDDVPEEVEEAIEEKGLEEEQPEVDQPEEDVEHIDDETTAAPVDQSPGEEEKSQSPEKQPSPPPPVAEEIEEEVKEEVVEEAGEEEVNEEIEEEVVEDSSAAQELKDSSASEPGTTAFVIEDQPTE